MPGHRVNTLGNSLHAKEKCGGSSYQLTLGTRIHRYRCSLPGLAGFTVYRREGTGTSHHCEFADESSYLQSARPDTVTLKGLHPNSSGPSKMHHIGVSTIAGGDSSLQQTIAPAQNVRLYRRFIYVLGVP